MKDSQKNRQTNRNTTEERWEQNEMQKDKDREIGDRHVQCKMKGTLKTQERGTKLPQEEFPLVPRESGTLPCHRPVSKN